jgi:hypothetical protein
MHRWGFTDIPDCDCGAEQQTVQHIENECPLRSFPGGLAVLNEAGPDALEYLRRLDLNLQLFIIRNIMGHTIKQIAQIMLFIHIKS